MFRHAVDGKTLYALRKHWRPPKLNFLEKPDSHLGRGHPAFKSSLERSQITFNLLWVLERVNGFYGLWVRPAPSVFVVHSSECCRAERFVKTFSTLRIFLSVWKSENGNKHGTVFISFMPG